MSDLAAFRAAVRAWAADGVSAPPGSADDVRAVVLVEGVSDLRAVEALAARQGRDLDAEGVCVVPMGGAMGVARFLRLFGPGGLPVEVRGLYDEAEERWFSRGLERAGFGAGPDRPAMAALGFHVCVADLEDELIRALGVTGVEAVLAAEGDLERFRLFQRQPAQQDRPVERQLRRFLGTTSGRKEQYGRALVEAITDRVPTPLDLVLRPA